MTAEGSQLRFEALGALADPRLPAPDRQLVDQTVGHEAGQVLPGGSPAGGIEGVAQRRRVRLPGGSGGDRGEARRHQVEGQLRPGPLPGRGFVLVYDGHAPGDDLRRRMPGAPRQAFAQGRDQTLVQVGAGEGEGVEEDAIADPGGGPRHHRLQSGGVDLRRLGQRRIFRPRLTQVVDVGGDPPRRRRELGGAVAAPDARRAGADAEREAAAGEARDVGRGGGHRPRRASEGVGDPGGDADSLGRLGDYESADDRVAVLVLGRPDPVQSGAARPGGRAREAARGRLSRRPGHAAAAACRSAGAWPRRDQSRPPRKESSSSASASPSSAPA